MLSISDLDIHLCEMAFVGFESLNDEIFQTQLKAKYKSKIFIGNFKEKRLVESLKCYRDAILIETTQEKEFAKDLESFLQEIYKHMRSQIYVGVTKNDDENFTIWTELEEDCNAFGKYWFQVWTWIGESFSIKMESIFR